MAGASRKTDIGSGHDGYPPTPAIAGSSDVEIEGLPALRKGDALAPHTKPKSSPHPRKVSGGSPTVFINGKPAARIGDAIDCGGSMTGGAGTVILDEG